ncbi:unnamed protein product [Nippostrongylus brasiliensis]|uniref:Helix-loop-helix protein 11 (inferred by orthology to a C. elegans protein) n=1 Tax=Nippostrongylus brasiliensis TaxID=27835 RepID=A0A0N4XKE6_NIPBR|nr:unnamed protein product [Nippostrongylus brasiliensis]
MVLVLWCGSVRPDETIDFRPTSRSASSLSPNSSDPDRRLRRQIANCNERRRMQSINAGFQSLRALLPRKEGEKLSKAAILQHTADLIQQLQSERSRYSDKDEVGGKKPKLESRSRFNIWDSLPYSRFLVPIPSSLWAPSDAVICP